MAVSFSEQPSTALPPSCPQTWHKRALLFITISFALRLLFIGLQDLLPEEAYYWQFAHHLDWSYLDHPPMVAWLIYIGTAIFGHNEFGTRIGAFICASIAAVFVWKLTKLLFSRDTALIAVLFAAILPYFFIGGFLITPDAPLAACWAGALYFLAKVFLEKRPYDWLAVGACLGIGMVSKYSIALVGISTLLFMLLHKPSRRWFFSPWPYAAAVLCFAFFSPVIYWNATHEWASFAFQTSRRLAAAPEFGLHTLFISLICLVTPSGLAAAWIALRRPNRTSEDLEGFRSLFLRVYLGVPLAVFAIFSINHEPKLNWAGPAFLIALPFFADLLRQGRSATPAQSFVYKTWFPTLTFLLVAYAGLFLYIRYGVPFGGYFKGSQRFVGWHDLGRQLGELASAKQGSETTRTVLVGMDKHFIASEIGYYTPYWKSGAAPLPVDALAGRNIFEMNALMWEQWTPANLSGATLLLVARSKSDLEKDIVGTFVSSQDPIQEISVSSRSKKVGTYYYRWAYNYKPRPQ